MIQQWLNGKTLLFIIARSIVTGTIFYSRYLSKKIADDEKRKVDLWVEAQKTIIDATDSTDQATFNLAAKISAENKEIPIIETDENDKINPINCVNLDSNKIKKDSNYLQKKLGEFKTQHDPIVQLIIVGLFIIITIIAQRTAYLSTQNQLWAGMAKETAHQLGTPVSSLKGWVEVLKDIRGNEKITSEIEKDVNRLELITDRFGKIGSRPHLEASNVVKQINNMVEYIKKRAGVK